MLMPLKSKQIPAHQVYFENFMRTVILLWINTMKCTNTREFLGYKNPEERKKNQ